MPIHCTWFENLSKIFYREDVYRGLTKRERENNVLVRLRKWLNKVFEVADCAVLTVLYAKRYCLQNTIHTSYKTNAGVHCSVESRCYS